MEWWAVLGSYDSEEDLQVIMDNYLHMSSWAKAAADVASFP